jgi:hypothetical protein
MAALDAQRYLETLWSATSRHYLDQVPNK